MFVILKETGDRTREDETLIRSILFARVYKSKTFPSIEEATKAILSDIKNSEHVFKDRVAGNKETVQFIKDAYGPNEIVDTNGTNGKYRVYFSDGNLPGKQVPPFFNVSFDCITTGPECYKNSGMAIAYKIVELN